MRRTIARSVLAAAALALLAFGFPLAAQDKPSADKLLGTWALEVNAGGESYYLTLELKLIENLLGGGLSEQSGMFTNVPLTGVEWDGTTLKFGVKIPTPPDGTERATKCEMKYAEGKLAGTILIEELGLTAAVSGTKK